MDYKNRNEIEEIYKWDLAKLFKTKEDWEKEYKKIKKSIPKMKTFKGTLLDKPINLFNAFETYYFINTSLVKLYIYANTKFDEDVSNSNNSLLVDKALGLWSLLAQESSYLEPEVLSGKKTALNKLIKDKKLAKYKFHLEDLIRSKDHQLSEEEEIIVAKLSESTEAFEKINSILTNSILDYGSVEIDGEDTPITNSN